MDRERIRRSIAEAVADLRIADLSDEELGIGQIEEIVRQSETLSATANKMAFGISLKKRLGGMDATSFREWLMKTVSERVKELICGKLYTEIDTPEERVEIVRTYADEITDAIISSYPQLVLAKPLIRHLVAWLLARGLARAAQNLGEYCAVE